MISVIMPTYNEPIEIIKTSAESILCQTYTDIELILIIDMPSRNDILEYVKQRKDSRVVVIKHEKNHGLTASLNEGVERAKGAYIARMDADDISVPERLQKQMNYLIKNQLDLIGSNIIDIDMNEKKADKATVYPGNNQSIKRFMRFNSPMAHPTWFGKADLFKNNKYKDYLACEDYEFLTRITLSGYKIGNINEILLYYRKNNKGVSSSKRAIQKTSLHYIRKQYKKGVICNYTKYKNYMSSKKGRSRCRSIEKMYAHLREIKQSIIYHGISLLANRNFYEISYNNFMSNRIRNKSGV